MQFPVYFDSDRRFIQANNTRQAPLALLTNEDGQVVAANYPILGHEQLDEPFRNACRRYFVERQRELKEQLQQE